MKEQKRIPTTKIQRASRFIRTGANIGGNYLKHYSKRLVNPGMDKTELHEDNATDIYASLSELKGSALKVAQMLSMDKNVLPTAYQKQFSMAQYSAPPLSFPLINKTFEKYFKKKPGELFDSFSPSAINAASMGQVHAATIGGKKLAVKVQYPGVADSVKSDLAMVKPIALKMFKLNPADYDEFIGEVEARLTEEANYSLELERSIELSRQCSVIKNLRFPAYYPEYSCAKILTMDWLDGMPLGAYLKSNQLSASDANRLGQAMWDFYHFQMHQLKRLHADPHPGNFIVTSDKQLGIIDFGCVKVIPDDFYLNYFQLLEKGILDDKPKLEQLFYDLRFIYPDDKPEDKIFFKEVFTQLIELLGRPFRSASFDFADNKYLESLYTFGESISKMKAFRSSKRARGVKDALYINRTYFGIYNLLNEMRAKVNTHSWTPQFK